MQFGECYYSHAASVIGGLRDLVALLLKSIRCIYAVKQCVICEISGRGNCCIQEFYYGARSVLCRSFKNQGSFLVTSFQINQIIKAILGYVCV
jgi:hypothetical protein